MRWPRDAQSSLGARLRTLVVLGLVVAIGVESPLRESWGASTGLNPGGTGTVAGSRSPPPDVLGEPELATAAKRKRNAQDNDPAGTHKRSKTDKPGEDKNRNRDKSGKDKPGKNKSDNTHKPDKDKR